VHERKVWGKEVVYEKLTTALDTFFSGDGDSPWVALSPKSREIPPMYAKLPREHVRNSTLQGLQLMTNDYTKGKAGFYMTLKIFSKNRKCERMIAKIQFPVPIHLLDHSNTRLRRPRVPLVSSVHGRKIPTHKLSRLELRLQLCRLQQKILLGKFYRMAWTVHAHADAPAPSWVVHPARMTSLHTRLTKLTAACLD